MGTLNLILAVVNIFIAGMQFSLWLRSRQLESMVWTAANFGAGIFCLLSGVGGVVNTATGS